MNLKKISKTNLINEIESLRSELEQLRLQSNPVVNAERKITDDLRKSNERYKNLLENISEVIFDIDKDGIVKYVSKAVERITGFKAEHLTGKHYSSLIHESFDESAKRLIELKRTKTSQRELKLKDANGIEHWFSFSTNAIFKNNEFIGASGLMTDISERKEAEEKLRASEERYRHIFETVQDAYYEATPEGIILDISPSIYTISNKQYTREELIGNSILQYYYDLKEREQLIEKLYSEDKVIDYEFTFINKDGSIVPVSISSSLLRDNMGIPTKITGSLRNISQRKQNEVLLRKLSRAVEQSPVSIVITDIVGKIEYANPKAIESTGYSKEELIGQNPRVLKSGETPPVSFTEMWETISKGNIWKGIFKNKKKSGEKYVERSTIAPVIDDNGRITNYIALKEDITSQIKAEEDALLFRSIAEKANYGTVITDMEGKIVYVNETMAKMHGLTLTDLTDKKLSVFHNQEQIDLVIELLHELVEKGSFDSREVWHYHKAGYSFPTLMTANTIYNENGYPQYLSATAVNISEMKAAESALRKSEQKLNYAQEMVQMGNWEIEFNSEKFYWSDNFYRILGLKPQQSGVKAENFTKMIHPDDISTYNKMLINSKKQQQSISKDIRLIMPDGSLKWISYHVRPTIENKKVKGLNGVILDITETKSRNKELARLSQAVTQSPVAVLITDTDGNMEFANPAFEKISGYTFAELYGKHTRVLKSGLNEKSTYVNLWETITKGDKWQTEWINKRKNGVLYWEQITISPIINEKGLTTNFLALKQDISERKKFEEEILELNTTLEKKVAERTAELEDSNKTLVAEISDRKKAEELLLWNKSLLEMMSNSSPLGFLVVDNRTDDILYFNKRFCEIWEIEHLQERMHKGELKNNDIIPYCIPVLADVEAFAASCSPLQDENNTIVLSDEIPFTNNRTIHRYTTQIRGANNRYFGRFYIFEDVTDVKKHEQELNNARRDAEIANIAKSEFLSRMSHELRTPLNSILGFTQLLEMSEPNLIQQKGINHILQSGRHLLNLINEVLDISRIESGNIQIVPETIVLKPLINEMLDVIRPLANNRNITLPKYEIPDNLCVTADNQRLKQVLLNLLNNAVKYNKENGQIEITISESGENMIRLEITDTGLGLSADDLNKIFVPFERASAAKTDIEGTGLGLSVSKKMMDAMNGTIGVKSRLNIGSTFWIEIPKSKCKMSESVNSTYKLPDAANKTTKIKILYIEDNESSIELIENIISMHRPASTVIALQDESKALKYATLYNPDLILLDLNLNGSHGSEILAILKNNQSTKHIPVIIISADAMYQDKEKLLQSGAKNYITKPVDVNIFLKLIDSCLPTHNY